MFEPMESAEGRPNILLVDDSRLVRKSITQVLDSEFNVCQASDGEAGLMYARELKPDLVITDIMMPVMDGYGLICALRGHHDSQLSDVPIIVITAAGQEYVRERAYACGANAFINKSFDTRSLLDSVNKNLAHSDVSTAELSKKYDARIMSICISDLPEDRL
jgi:PleD family two-component response regulator